MDRHLRVEVDGRDLWIATAEDLVLLKLLASRPRDTLDVADVLFVSGQLDATYLRHWAGVLGIQSQLEQALRNLDEDELSRRKPHFIAVCAQL